MAIQKISVTNPQEPDCNIVVDEDVHHSDTAVRHNNTVPPPPPPPQLSSLMIDTADSLDSFDAATIVTTSSISSCGSNESNGSSSKPSYYYYHHHSHNNNDHINHSSNYNSATWRRSFVSPLHQSPIGDLDYHQQDRYQYASKRRRKPNRTLLYTNNKNINNYNNSNQSMLGHPQQTPMMMMKQKHRYSNNYRTGVNDGGGVAMMVWYRWYNKVSAIVVSTLLVSLTVQRLLSLYFTHRRWINAPITYMHRTCPLPQYELLSVSPTVQLTVTTATTLLEPLLPLQQSLSSSSSSSETTSETSSSVSTTTQQLRALSRNERAATFSANQTATTTTTTTSPPLKICLTSLTDQKSPSFIQRLLRWRNFDGIMTLTRPNKIAYAQKHGYHVYDGSDQYDSSRPPAWSKIRAIQALFQPIATTTTVPVTTSTAANNIVPDEPPCDWVLWMDADTVVMNSDIRIEDFLPADPNKDFVVVSDKNGGYNSGVLLFRNSVWSHQFLEEWWNMNDFVRPPGLSLSGDNAALKALLRTMEEQNTFTDHIVVPPRCTMNSFAHFLTLGQSVEIMDHLTEQAWYYDTEHYHKGDFIAHIPGFDNKAECLKLLLREAR